ncbi:MAG: LysR family transcriptional regulator, partial [Sphingomonadaceae bacterium]
MRFERLDLNLLVALDIMLQEKSVSLAADRLCLSQSATSSALGRLRDYFEDDLLVLKGRQMVLTPRAEELIEPVRDVLERIRSTITVAPPFDPATSDRTIRFMASDYITEVLLADQFRSFEHMAPNMRFEVQPMAVSPVEFLERGMIDLLLTVDFALSSDHPVREMFLDDFVVIGDRSNSALEGEVTQKLYHQLGHVTIRFGRSRVPAFEDWYLRRQNKQRRVEVVAPTFLAQPALLMGTRRIATIQRLLAERFTRTHDLVIRELPFEM